MRMSFHSFSTERDGFQPPAKAVKRESRGEGERLQGLQYCSEYVRCRWWMHPAGECWAEGNPCKSCSTAVSMLDADGGCILQVNAGLRGTLAKAAVLQ